MNWGYRIFAFYTGFVALTIFMVYSAFQHNVNLVTADYYERELEYQKIIDGAKNVNAAEEKVAISLSSDELTVVLPAINPAQIPLQDVELWLYNEADGSRDVIASFDEAMTNRFILPLGESQKGRYVLKVKWEQSNTPFYFEKPMIIE